MALKSKDLAEVRADVPVEKVMPGGVVRLNMNVAKSTRDAWKKAAVDLNMDVTQLVHTAVQKYLDEHMMK